MDRDLSARDARAPHPIAGAPRAPEGPGRPDPLEGYLAALRRDGCFRVDAVLKSSPVEETQRVYFEGVNGAEQGPFVRKLIDRDAGLGSVYRALYDLRRSGRRLRYLPAVYDCHEAGGKLVVLMEHVPGVTLRELVAGAGEEGRAALVLRAFPALCDAVAELHGAFASPVVHRDLTPSNVVCPPADPAALTVVDLGIARTYKPGADADTAYFGTRPYAPPEQFGFGQTDVRTDVYALGMVLFFCLTGRDATRADRARGFADPAVPEPLRAVVERAARLEPAERYRDAVELKAAFEEAADCLRAAPEGVGAGAGPQAGEGSQVGKDLRAGEGPQSGEGPRAAAGPDVLAAGEGPRAGGSAATGPDSPAAEESLRAKEGLRAATKPGFPTEASEGKAAVGKGGAAAGPDVLAGTEAEALPAQGTAARRRGPRVPVWAGRLWNALVLAAYALVLVSCVVAIADPTPDNARWPLWFLVFSYAVVVNLTGALVAYLLLDKRRLFARFPALGRGGLPARALHVLAALGALWMVYLAVGIPLQMGLG